MEDALPAEIRRAVSFSDFESGLRLLHAHIHALDVPEATSYLDVTAGSLQTAYGKDGAGLLLGSIDGSIVGMIAYGKLGQSCSKLSYFYVSPTSRRHGLGNGLLAAVLAASRADGYHSVVLATLPKLAAAQAIYAAHGFARVPPVYPDLPGAEYYLRKL